MILFVCTGNTCRSAICCALLKELWGRSEFGEFVSLDVDSAGIDVNSPEEPASATAIEVLSERGIDLKGHRSQPVTADLLAAAELVIVMTRRHETAIATLEPTARSKTFLAGEVSRLGGIVGPKDGRSLADWVHALHSARGGHFTGGRMADEITDPWGGTSDDYRNCVDRLQGICEALASFLIQPAIR